MPISAKWDDDDRTILRLIFWNEWDLDEYLEQFESVISTIKTVAYTVAILVDLRADSFVPKGNTLRVFRYIMDKLPENVGLIVYVNDNYVQEHMFNTQISFYKTLRRRHNRRIHMVETLPEAYKLIQEHQITPY
ncbi:MAG: hypothetical protein Q9P44_06685 [Anaerolineae bacterium]|nr:hypothetical protein [Anaerolineae bacterium]